MGFKDVPSFADYIVDSITNNYYLIILITSYTQGKVKSMNLPFGLGKSTLAFWLDYILKGGSFDDPLNMKIWDKVFDTAAYFPYEAFDQVNPIKPGRLISMVWDDVQATAPRTQHVPEIVRHIAAFFTTTRNRVANLIMTAPNMSSIAKPLADIVIFEVIIAERGHYEVQKIQYNKNFKRPREDYAREIYIEEGDFPPLPPEIQKRYDEWRRQKQIILHKQLSAKLSQYMPIEIKEDNAIELEAEITKWTGGRYMVKLPRELGEKLWREGKTVKIIV